MAVQIQLRGGTLAEWTAANPIIAIREMVLETDTDKFKIGNGVHNYLDLPYGGLVGPQGVAGAAGPAGADGPMGPQGVSITLIGSVATVELLPSTGNEVNDAYIVDADGDLWVWATTGWYSAGQIVGPQGLTGATGPTGPSGVVAVTGPITNSGTSTSADIGINQDGFDHIGSLNYAQFDLTPTGVPAAMGTLSWNAVDKTLDLQSDGITYQLGQELAQNVMRVGAAGLENGKVVYVTGSDGANILVDYALATSDATSGNTFAVMTASASGGAKAPATTFGLVRNLNTLSLTEGATVYLSSTVPGGMTTTKPAAPVHTVQIGVCIRSHATEGSIFVSVQNGYELDELHDVTITGRQDGYVLAWNAATGLYNFIAPPTGPAGAPGRFTTSDTAPTSPVSGDAWLDSSTTKLFMYYSCWTCISTSNLYPLRACTIIIVNKSHTTSRIKPSIS